MYILTENNIILVRHAQFRYDDQPDDTPTGYFRLALQGLQHHVGGALGGEWAWHGEQQ